MPNRAMRAINPPAMEARRIRLQGERGISRKTTAQGMPECSSCTCMLVCAFLCIIAHETAGAASTPAFPAPSRWANDFANLGCIAPRECGHTFGCHHPRSV